MIQIKIRNNFFEIPKIPLQNDSLTKIDWLANQFYKTEDSYYINTLICIAIPYMRKVASSFCRNTEDAKELCQELKIDLLRLLRKWKPKEKMRFNYIMRRQFYNFSCNFIRKLKKVSFVDVELFQQELLDTNDFMKDYEITDLVKKLLSLVDDKTKQILTLFLSGVTTYEQIGKELSVTGVTVRNRILGCKPLILKILREGKNV